MFSIFWLLLFFNDFQIVPRLIQIKFWVKYKKNNRFFSFLLKFLFGTVYCDRHYFLNLNFNVSMMSSNSESFIQKQRWQTSRNIFNIGKKIKLNIRLDFGEIVGYRRTKQLFSECDWHYIFVRIANLDNMLLIIKFKRCLI